MRYDTKPVKTLVYVVIYTSIRQLELYRPVTDKKKWDYKKKKPVSMYFIH